MKDTIEITERPELKTSEIIRLMREKFPVWSYYDDERLDREFPAPKKATARYFLKEQEPDQETLGLSVNQAEKKGFASGITLRERLLLELAYFNETGKHLDVKGITFCSGSRTSNGSVPYVRFCDDGVSVYWSRLGRSFAECGVRSAVSFPSSLEPLSLSSSNNLTESDMISALKERGYRITRMEEKEY